MSNTGLFLRLLLLLCLASLTATAQRTIRVPQDQPTIQKAIFAAGYGDTVLVGPGTYYENIVFGTAPVTLLSSDGPEKTIIDGMGLHATVAIQSQGNVTSVIRGFTIQNGGYQRQQNKGETYGGVYVESSAPLIEGNVITNNYCGGVAGALAGPTVRNNLISHNHLPNVSTPYYCLGFGLSYTPGGWGVMLYGSYPPKPFIVTGNTIEENDDVLPGGGGGIYAGAANGIVIQSNIIRHNHGEAGIFILNQTESFLISQNLVVQNQIQCGGICVSDDIPSSDLGTPLKLILGNTVALNQRFDPRNNTVQVLLATLSPSRVLFANNVIYSTLSGIPAMAGGSTNVLTPHATPVVFDHNLVYSTIGAACDSSCAGQIGSYGNFSADPLFMNAATEDFRLSVSSPAIDAGNSSVPNLPTLDLQAQPRLQDATGKGYATIDIGAYELPAVSDPKQTTITLVPSAYYITGTPVTLSASLGSPLGVPTGSVDFLIDGTRVGSSTIDNLGNASVSVPNFAAGLHTTIATYSGQGAFSAAVSVKVYLIFDKGTPSLDLDASPTTIYALNPVIIRATVASGASGANAATGSVFFRDGSTDLGSVPLDSSSHAVLSTSFNAIGAHTITASYAGDNTYSGTSTSTVLQVVANPTSNALTLTPGTLHAYETVTATSRVTSSTTTAAPAGTAVFTVPGKFTHSATISATGTGTDSFSLPAGTYSISSTYGPASDAFLPSSQTQPFVVDRDATSLGLIANTLRAIQRQTVTLTAALTPSHSNHPIAGNISFYEGPTLLGTAQIDASNHAVLSLSTLSIGTHVVVANFAGSADFLASSSTSLTIQIIEQDFDLGVTPTDLKIQAEHHQPLTVTLTSIGQLKDTIQLSCVGLPEEATCTFNNDHLSLSAGGSATTQIIVDTDAVPRFKSDAMFPRGIVYAALLPLLWGVSRKRCLKQLLILALMIGAVTLTGCSSKYPAFTPPGTYKIQVIAVAQASQITHTSDVELTVTPP